MTTAEKSLTGLWAFKIIRRIEHRYTASITPLSRDPRRMIRLMRDLDKVYARLVAYVSSLCRYTPTGHPDGRRRLERYLREIQTIHLSNVRWLILYCDLQWPADAWDWRLKEKERKGFEAYVRAEAARFWSLLRRDLAPEGIPSREREIVALKNFLDRLPLNSSQWRITFEELSAKMYQALAAALTDSKYRFKNKFQIVMYAGSFEDILGQSGRAGPGTDFLRHFDRPRPGESPALPRRTADWLLGYMRLDEEDDRTGHQLAGRIAGAGLQAAQTRRTRFTILRGAAVGAAITLVGAMLYVSDVDDRLYETVAFKVKEFFQLDPASLALKEKKTFFNERIEAVRPDVDQQELLERVHYFLDRGLYRSRRGYAYFSEHILEGFFLLLSERHVSRRLVEDVLEAASRLNKRIGSSLQNIIVLYSRPVIRESQLREQMLDLREEFVVHDVLPFMFLVLKDNVPHLFVFTEPILGESILSLEDTQRLGLEVNKYSRSGVLPVKAYVVEGTRYPFKDLAGYFEGELAVVFRSLASRPDWTTYHEIGHVIDHLRYTYEDEGLAANTELNAVLFPVLLAGDGKDYITQWLVPLAMRANPNDYYSQAARGILNGVILYLSGKEHRGPAINDRLISGRFEQERILDAKERVRRMSAGAVREMGYALYRNREEYLGTTRPGRYIVQRSGMEEITRGAHGVAQRGFILGGGLSEGDPGKGPLFIRDGFEGDDGLDAPFDLGAFLKDVLRIIISPQQRKALGGRAEALVAAILVFIVVEGTAVFLHIGGAPLRIRKYRGRDTGGIVDDIYDRHPWSQGLSFGAEANERKLLKQVFAAQGVIDPRLYDEVAAFKSAAGDRQRALFDVCLLLAPFNPAKSVIVHKLHDILFFLPFLGPWLARSPTLFPVQKTFHQKETYNRRLAALARSAGAKTGLKPFLEEVKAHVDAYKTAVSPAPGMSRRGTYPWDEMERLVSTCLREEGARGYRLGRKLLASPAARSREAGHDFDRLDKYFPGDDFRYIDWNVTARSGSGEAMIRKYVDLSGVRLAFLLDMRFLDESRDREQWAQDFVRSLSVLEHDNILERLIFILRDGVVYEHTINLKAGRNTYATAQQILACVREKLDAFTFSKVNISLTGLTFYNSGQNEGFRAQVGLTDFRGGIQQIQRTRLAARSLNIFVIGDKIKQRQELEALIGEANQSYFW